MGDGAEQVGLVDLFELGLRAGIRGAWSAAHLCRSPASPGHDQRWKKRLGSYVPEDAVCERVLRIHHDHRLLFHRFFLGDLLHFIQDGGADVAGPRSRARPPRWACRSPRGCWARRRAGQLARTAWWQPAPARWNRLSTFSRQSSTVTRAIGTPLKQKSQEKHGLPVYRSGAFKPIARRGWASIRAGRPGWPGPGHPRWPADPPRPGRNPGSPPRNRTRPSAPCRPPHPAGAGR